MASAWIIRIYKVPGVGWKGSDLESAGASSL
jgi:hypothetical protein